VRLREHAIEQVDGGSRGGRSKGNTAIRRGKESLPENYRLQSWFVECSETIRSVFETQR
jgi:hypothetical protein